MLVRVGENGLYGRMTCLMMTSHVLLEPRASPACSPARPNITLTYMSRRPDEN